MHESEVDRCTVVIDVAMYVDPLSPIYTYQTGSNCTGLNRVYTHWLDQS